MSSHACDWSGMCRFSGEGIGFVQVESSKSFFFFLNTEKSSKSRRYKIKMNNDLTAGSWEQLTGRNRHGHGHPRYDDLDNRATWRGKTLGFLAKQPRSAEAMPYVR